MGGIKHWEAQDKIGTGSISRFKVSYRAGEMAQLRTLGALPKDLHAHEGSHLPATLVPGHLMTLFWLLALHAFDT